jgi:hypothetical protein
MSVIPDGRDDMLTFYANHIEAWIAKAALLGLDPVKLAAMSQALDAALAQQQSARQLRSAAQVATDQLNMQAAGVRAMGGAVVARIRANAESTGNIELFEAASLPMPRPATPAGPAEPAASVTAEPSADGTITVRWRGTVSRNQSFEIERSVDGGPRILIKSTRRKRYLDEAVPMNVAGIVYWVYGVRNEERSRPASTTVQFGTLPATVQAAFRAAS